MTNERQLCPEAPFSLRKKNTPEKESEEQVGFKPTPSHLSKLQELANLRKAMRGGE